MTSNLRATTDTWLVRWGRALATCASLGGEATGTAGVAPGIKAALGSEALEPALAALGRSRAARDRERGKRRSSLINSEQVWGRGTHARGGARSRNDQPSTARQPLPTAYCSLGIDPPFGRWRRRSGPTCLERSLEATPGDLMSTPCSAQSFATKFTMGAVGALDRKEKTQGCCFFCLPNALSRGDL